MVHATHEYKKKSSQEVDFVVHVPAGGKTEIRFEVRYDLRTTLQVMK